MRQGGSETRRYQQSPRNRRTGGSFESRSNPRAILKKETASLLFNSVADIDNTSRIKSLKGHRLLLPVVALVAVVAVLIHGAWDHQPSAEAAPSLEIEPPPEPPTIVRPDLDKGALAYFSDYWLQLGERARKKITFIGPQRAPAIVVAAGLAVTSMQVAEDFVARGLALHLAEQHAAPGPGENPRMPAGDETTPANRIDEDPPNQDTESAPAPYRLLGVDSDLELAVFVLEKPYRAAPFRLLNPAAIPTGSFVAAISIKPDDTLRIKPGHLISANALNGLAGSAGSSLEVSVGLTDLGPAAAIVDLDGSLAGVALESSRGGVRLHSSEAVRRSVENLRQGRPCLSIEVAELMPDAAAVLGLNGGVVIERVRAESFVPEPSLRAGDILLRFSRADIHGVEQFEQLYIGLEPGKLVRYVVFRDGKRLSGGTVLPNRDCRPITELVEVFPRMGLALRWVEGGSSETGPTEAGWRVAATTDHSPAAQSGLKRGDRVIALNQRTLGRDTPIGAFDGFERLGRAVVLTVQRDDRVQLVVVTPRPD